MRLALPVILLSTACASDPAAVADACAAVDAVVDGAAFALLDGGGIACEARSRAVSSAGSLAGLTVAVAALALADEGMLDLDAPVGELAPGLSLGADARGITLAEALSGRSGLPARAVHGDVPLDLFRGDEAVDTWAPPGEVWIDSALGVGLAAAAVEEVTHLGIGEVIDARINGALGLDDGLTAYDPTACGDVSLYATPADAAAFVDATLLSDALLSTSSKRRLLASFETRRRADLQAGLGVMHERWGDLDVIVLDGWLDQSAVWAVPSLGVAAVVASAQGGSREAAEAAVAAWLDEQPSPAVPAASSPFEAYTGGYFATQDVGRLEVSADGDHLLVDRVDAGWTERLVHVDGDTFATERGALVTFWVGESGAARWLVLPDGVAGRVPASDLTSGVAPTATDIRSYYRGLGRPLGYRPGT